MGKTPSDRISIKFSTPDPFINEIKVLRIMPDDSTQVIGRVYPDLKNKEDSIIYVSVNNLDEEIFPPTTDFIEVENQFKKYAKKLSEQFYSEDIETEVEKFENREESIKNIRNWQFKNREAQQINL